MAVEYPVALKFEGKDGVSKIVAEIGDKTVDLGFKLEKAFDKGSGAAKKFGGVTGKILKAGVIVKGAGATKSALQSVIAEFIKFDDAIVSASAKFKGLDESTRAGRVAIEKLRNAARQVGIETQFTSAAAAQGIEFLAMAGFNAEQSMAALPGAADLATNAQIDLARATDIVSDSLGAFNLMSDDSAKLTENLTRVNDVYAQTMSRTNTGIEALFEATKKGGPTFVSAGQRIETFNAMLGTLANAGIKGGEAGTHLRNVMTRLAKPTKEAQGILDALGVTVKDGRGDFRDIVDVLGDFERGLEGVGTAERAAALKMVFGEEAISGVNILLDAGADKIRSFRGELDKSGGASQKMAAHIRKGLGPQLAMLRSAAGGVGERFVEAFKVEGVSVIKLLTDKLRTLDVKPLIDGLKSVVSFFTGLFKVITFLIPSFRFFVFQLVAYQIATKGIIALKAVRHFLMLTKVIKGATVAQKLYNLATKANPLGLIIIGIGVIVALIAKLIKHWDKVKGFFKKIGGFFGLGKDKGMLKGKEPIGDILSTREDRARQAAEEIPPPPNREQVAALMASNDINFRGQLNIAGAPPGSTVKSHTSGAPPIDVVLMGANP